MPIMYPNLAQVQEMNREQLLFLYKNLPIAENPREIEVIREVSILLGPNPVPELLKQAEQQLSPTTEQIKSYSDSVETGAFTPPTVVSGYQQLDHPITIDAELVETRDKSILLALELNHFKYGMLKFKPKIKVFFPKTKVNQLSKLSWEIEREILVSNLQTQYSKFRDYCKSKYSATIPEDIYLKGGLTL